MRAQLQLGSRASRVCRYFFGLSFIRFTFRQIGPSVLFSPVFSFLFFFSLQLRFLIVPRGRRIINTKKKKKEKTIQTTTAARHVAIRRNKTTETKCIFFAGTGRMKFLLFFGTFCRIITIINSFSQ